MQETKNFRQTESMQLSECITSIDATEQFVAAGCLDQNLYVWKADLNQFNTTPLFSKGGHTMGIVDLQINRKSTHLTVSCMDSTIRQWEIDTQNSQKIECEVMQNWKVCTTQNQIITGGTNGKISFYDMASRQKTKKIDAGQVFLTSLSLSNNGKFLATGNDDGGLFIIHLSNKDKLVALKPHFKIIRSIDFVEDSTKIITGSDDNSVGMIDISNQKVVSSFQGHKQAVSCVSCHPIDSRIFFSCSFDKSIKCWDARMKDCIGSVSTGSQLWSCKATIRHLIAGGQSGLLSIYSIQ